MAEREISPFDSREQTGIFLGYGNYKGVEMKKGNLSCLAADALTRKIGGLSKDTGTFLQDYSPCVQYTNIAKSNQYNTK